MEPWFSIDGPWKSPMAFYYSSSGTPWFVCICMWPQCLSGRCGAGKGLLSLLIRLIRWKKSIRESTKEFSFESPSKQNCHVCCDAGHYLAD